jgi:hypothetical protein
LVANFIERPGTIPGGCRWLNTAVDGDDGNPVLQERARKALRGWRNCLISVIHRGIKAREIRSKIDARKLAPLIISSREGAVMVYSLNGARKRQADYRPISTVILKTKCAFGASSQSFSSLRAISQLPYASRGNKDATLLSTSIFSPK